MEPRPAPRIETASHPLRALSTEDLRRHRLLAFAASRGWIETPESRAALLTNARNESLDRQTIATLGEIFARDGLTVGLLKGPALWDDFYRLGEREISDLDLFIERERAQALEQSLERAGYKAVSRSVSKLSGFKVNFESAEHPNLSVETHTKLWWKEPDDFRWRWQSAAIGFKKLQIEDQFLHLSGHWVAQHTCLLLSWLVDILLILEQRQLDWDYIWETARKLRWERAVACSLKIAEDFSRSVART